MRVLVSDADGPDLRVAIEREGFFVAAVTGQDLDSFARSAKYDVIILNMDSL